MTGPYTDVRAPLGYWPADAGDLTTHGPHIYDMRGAHDSYAPAGLDVVSTAIGDAHRAPDAGLETTGFQCMDHPSAVRDFYDNDEVMRVYYPECRKLAERLTGATRSFTYDHLIREPGRQISGGGTDGQPRITGEAQGGGYVGAVHMDYTDNTTWHDYLRVHGEHPPEHAERVIALNFWRPVSDTVEDQPLAVCDARTVRREDLFETVVYGYGADNYSWHDLGIETYNVKNSPRQRWYYYPGMRPKQVLVFKSYDSHGVIGRACPHASFQHPHPSGVPRRSIELRVLCYIP